MSWRRETMSFNENKARKITSAIHGQWFGSYGVERYLFYQDNNQGLLLSNDKVSRALARCYAGCCFDNIIHELRSIELIEGNGRYFGQSLIGYKSQKGFRIRALVKKTSSLANNNNLVKAEVTHKLWNAAWPIDGTRAGCYFHDDNIDCALPDSLRFHEDCRHLTDGWFFVMIAKLDRCNVFALLRTYVLPDRRKVTTESARAVLDSVLGVGLHLTACTCDRLVICEGIETGISLARGLLLEPSNIWAALSISSIKELRLAKQVEQLTIALDDNRAGQLGGKALGMDTKAQCWMVKEFQRRIIMALIICWLNIGQAVQHERSR